MSNERTHIAARNLRLCTKDCLCLYVCPTGASDTENSIIDPERCLGCGECARACPSGAISLVPLAYPPQQPKASDVLAPAFELAAHKAEAEGIARMLAATAGNEPLGRLAAAFARAERLVTEDLVRESGFMLPQSKNAHDLLRAMIANPPGDDFPRAGAQRLLELLPENDAGAAGAGPAPEADGEAAGGGARGTAARTYRCLMCGAVFDVPEGEAPACPVCGASADYLELVEG